MNAEVISKIMSGRLWLVLVSGVVFAYATYAKILQPEAIASILTAVFTSYFLRSDRPINGGNHVEKPISVPPA